MRIAFGLRARAAVRGLVVAALAAGLVAAAPKTSDANPKYAAIVVDTATGKVLYEANANSRRYPASLTKMMTLYVLFEDLERGRFKLNSQFTVSKNAAAQPPSKLGLRAGSTISVEDAIRALVTKSANDAATAVGENVSGSVPAFAERMTRTARALGMKNTRFLNPHGLPNSGQYTTARDMMLLGVALQVRFPKYYSYFQTTSFTYKGRRYGNHNNLLGRVEGVDGIKTGYINASGFNLVSSVKRDGRKIVAVVMGGRTARSRDAHMIELISTYLPRASRSKGYDDELVAQIRSVPKVAASSPHPEPVVTAQIPASLANHPLPQARPTIVVAAAMPDPAALVPSSQTPPVATTRVVRTQALPVPIAPPAPVSLATATLPSSAMEAFGEIQTEQGSTDQDMLGDMIERKLGADAPVVVASADPVAVPMPPANVPAAAPAPVPAEAPAPVAARPPVSGWLIQIGAVDSETAANALLAKAQSKAGSALANVDPMTERFEKGSQTYVRARFAGFDSQKAAQRACAALKKNDFACYALRL